VNRARLEALLVEVLVAIHDQVQREDHGEPLSVAGRCELQAAAPGLVRELEQSAVAVLDGLSNDDARRLLRARIEPAFRRALAEAGERPS
jgi:hypothetical protein